MTGLPAPDEAQIWRFFTTLFAGADVGTHIALRAFEEHTSRPWRIERWSMPAIGADGLDPIIEAACELARAAAVAAEPVAFAIPVCTFLSAESAAEKNVAQGLCIAVDCDQAPHSAWERLENLLGPATLAVASGGMWQPPDDGVPEPKVHCYWRLRVPAHDFADLVKLKEARRRAAWLVDGDAASAPVSHPFRVPGSLHRKGAPARAELLR
jgi:hypothetical protein